MRNNNFKISMVLPALNEEGNVEASYTRLSSILNAITENFEIIFVDDGSTDSTLAKLKELNAKDSRLNYISFARNYGEQKSLTAGIMHATGDLVISMDADLQHPPEYIPSMVGKWKEGNDIIVMKRKEVGHKSFFKKYCEIIFYKILMMMSDTPIFFRFSGYSLLDRKAIDALKSYNEADPFLRGMIGHIGLKVHEMEYSEAQRMHGKSNYNFFKLVKLALTGITSFSAVPLYLSFYVGIGAVFLSLIYAIFGVISYLLSGHTVQGWASTIIVIIFLGGIQLITTGILGIYVSKIFIQTKNRPLFLIKEISKF